MLSPLPQCLHCSIALSSFYVHDNRALNYTKLNIIDRGHSKNLFFSLSNISVVLESAEWGRTLLPATLLKTVSSQSASVMIVIARFARFVADLRRRLSLCEITVLHWYCYLTSVAVLKTRK